MASSHHRYAAPLLILLLSTSVQAQYTLRGRVTPYQDLNDSQVARREEPAAPGSTPAPLRGEAAGGDAGDDPKSQGGDSNPRASHGEDKWDNPGGGDGSKALYLASHEDFCVFGPAEAGTTVAHAGDNVVSWCTKDHGRKMIPEGTFTGVTYVKTPNYVQVSGYGNFAGLNIAGDDLGGQFDSSEHTPSGAQLLLGADHTPASDWVTVIGGDTFCVRACTGDPQFCPTQYDELGCWFITNDGVGWPGEFQDCEGEDGDVPGVIDGSTFTPGQGATPTSLNVPAVSNCNKGSGSGSGAGAGSDGKASEHTSSTGAHASGGGTGSTSTSWVPVETCVPCEGAGSGSGSGSSTQASATGSGSSPALSGTTEVGMSQLQTAGSLSGSGSGAIAAPTTAPKASGDALVQKRQQEGGEGEKKGGESDEGKGEHDSVSDGGEKTVTKGDQCCFTTWTPAAGAAKPTVTGTGTGAAKSGATSAHPYESMSGIAPSKSLNGTGAGSGGINSTTGATNATGNDTDSGAGSLRVDSFGVDGMSRIVGGLVVGLLGGGWMLV